MSRRVLILAVVVLLIASSMMVLAPAQARGATPAVPHSAAPHPAVTTIELITGNGQCPYDYCNESFYSTGSGDSYYYGPGTNLLYFGVRDTAGDTSVNFTLTDPNASRDGVSSPAFSAHVVLNNTTGEYLSYQSGLSYTFPANLKIGGGWNVSVSAPLGGTVSLQIFVATYYEEIYGSPYPDSNTNVLPGETITTDYGAYLATNSAPDAAITNVSYYGTYTGANATVLNLFASTKSGIITQPAAALGGYTWKVPANATFDTYIDLNVWVSIYVGGQMAENESYGVSYEVGTLYIDSYTMESNDNSICPEYHDGTFDSGSLVQVCAVVGAFGGEDQFTAIAGLPVGITFWNGKATVTPPGFTSNSLVSNATGVVSFSFEANSTQFSSEYAAPFYNSVNLTVTNPGAAKIVPPFSEVWSNNTFFVDQSGASAGVTLGLNQLSYFPGQTITASWAINPTNPAQIGPVSAVAWYLYSDEGLLAQGPISSTALSGTQTITLPSGYIGEFDVEVQVVNATTSFWGYVYAYVTAPVLSLNPSSTTFTPGSTVTIQATAWGDAALSSPSITYQIYAEYGNDYTSYGDGGTVGTGTISNGSSIVIDVPSTGAPTSYWVYAYLSSTGAGTVATANLTVYQSWGYNIFLGVTTASSYSDGSYQPGQTVTVSYQISAYGNAPLPVIYTFTVGLVGTQISNLVSTPSTSGTFQVTIPSGWQTGVAILQLRLTGTYLYGNSCLGGFCSGMTAITINAHPSVLSEELGAGSGLTVGWLILLIIVLVLFVVTLLLIRRKRTSPPSGGTPPVTTPMAPPAPAPSSPGAAEWVEPASTPPAGNSQPPMPTPPPGAT
jgi:hypothetical protein